MASGASEEIACSKDLTTCREGPPAFEELLPEEFTQGISFVQFYAAEIPKTLGSSLLRLLSCACPLGQGEVHLKRARASKSDKAKLEVLLSLEKPPEEVLAYLEEHACSPPHQVQVPKREAMTREQLADFSQYWPLTYRKPSFEPLQLTETTRSVFARHLVHAQEVGEGSCGCVIVKNGTTLAAVKDRSTEHPLKHSVIVAIGMVAESLRRSQATKDTNKRPAEVEEEYLCTDCEVFTTHEPCVMCAMALLHSRVQLVVYSVPDPEFGGLGGFASLHSDKRLNHQFRVVRCLGHL